MAHQSSFDIRSASDFLHKMVLPQYSEFTAKNSSSRHALLAMLVAYHMYEWVHANKFSKGHFAENYRSEPGMADIFELARTIVNGTKHFSEGARTTTQTGYSSAYSDAYARPLNVELPDGSTESADRIIRKMVDFWKSQEEMGKIPG
ncbi:MAG: hypothetical protein OXC19_05800 [Bryobacterales bacterium]|nr:hypothetical protein [Bryobacterales bacterium]